jgi:hypothetical protein
MIPLNMVRRGLILIIIFFITCLHGKNTFAHEALQNDCDYLFSWGEIRTDHFAIVYSPANIVLAQSIASYFGDDLDVEYEQFSSAFGEPLETPISIRIYPDENSYFCLNTLSPLLKEGATHAHIGYREISLMANNIQADYETWQSKAMNGFRYELVLLFGEQLSNGIAPAGLLAGLGGYAEDPAEIFEERHQKAEFIAEASLRWQALWEDDVLPFDDSELLQATTTVAYLIDIYGWNRFIDFLGNIAVADGYRQAALDIYGLRIQELQRHWSDYFKVYISDRWRFNVFHNYHLEVFQELIEAGAYEDAVGGLQEAIPLIDIFGEEDDLVYANELLTISQMGVQAGVLVADARQSLIAGEYQQTIDLTTQASGIYKQLGDERRLGELEVYISIAQEVLSLRNDIEEIKPNVPYPGEVQRLIEISKRLSELGDQQGVSAAEIALTLITAGQRKFVELIFWGGALIILILLLRRIFRLKNSFPPETELL